MTIAASISHDIVFDGVARSSGSENVTGEKAIEFSLSIPANSTDLALPLVFTTAKLKSVWFRSDQAMTLEFNSGSVPAPAKSLAANVAFEWSTGSGLTNPFTVDVTALYVTNAGLVAANFEAHILVDCL